MKRQKDVRQSRHDWPFSGTPEFINRFEEHLKRRGHTYSTKQRYLSSIKHFLSWFETSLSDERKISSETIQIFLREHLPVCRCPEPVYKEIKTVRAALNQMLSMAGHERVRTNIGGTSPEIETAIELFDKYLRKVCGHAEATRWYHRRHVRTFLSWLFGDRTVSVDKITPENLCRFVTEQAIGLRPSSIGVLIYSLRAYLKFLQFNGHVTPSLEATIPRPPNWSGANLPSALNSRELARFWSVFDHTTAIGKRDYAMARCLAAIRSFLHYAVLQEPSALSMVQRVFAVPMKRFERPMISFLNLKEIEMILDTPDPNTWSGRRDRTLLATLYNTGARVSEIVNIKCVDLENRQCSALHLRGKGRKHRVVPLWKRTSQKLRQWLPQIDQHPHSPLFPNRFGKTMTRSGVEKQLRSAVTKARKRCPSIAVKQVSPHTIRHTTAMHLLQSGADLSVIALWLGHESVVTTHHYMQADLEMKKQALNRMEEPKIGGVRFKPSEDVLAFLDSL